MLVGIFADIHDHLDNLRRAVEQFNGRGCELVVFAGDFVSTFAIPPLRRLACPLVACFGDNEGNRIGIQGGMQIVGPVSEPPVCVKLSDGTRLLLTHQLELARGLEDGCQVVVYAHTHRSRIHRDRQGRLYINPGETSGWSYRRPSVAVLETRTMRAELVMLEDAGASG